MAIILNLNDKREVTEAYPTLSCSLKRQVVWGTLDVDACYDSNQEVLIFENTADNYIRDSYEIRIDFNQVDAFGLPRVFEESGKIEAFSVERGISLADLHVNSDGSCCLGIYPNYEWQGVLHFICYKIISYFYWQSFYKIYGEEPWEGYSHGKQGLYEALSEIRNSCRKGCFRNQPCSCGSGKKYKMCCYINQSFRRSALIEFINSDC